MTTLRDVARHAQTSVAAASAVLSGRPGLTIRVGPDTRARIRLAAEELGYSPNPIARSLVTRKTGAIGLVLPYSNAFIDRNPFCTQVMSGVLEEAVRARYNVMLHSAVGEDWTAVDENAYIDPRVDGILLVLPRPHSRLVARCLQVSYRCVAIVYDPDHEDVHVVNADDFAGGKMATEHLLALGHRRIAHFSGTGSISTAAPRRAGYLAAMQAADVELDPSWVLQGGFDHADGARCAERLLELPAGRRPTAVFAANDLSANGVLDCLRERAVDVPGEISVVGYDDTWFAALTHPTLTSVHMPIAEMATLAANMLISLIEGREIENRQPVLPVSITVRESTGLAPATANA